jgi:hypothetical protein
MNVAGLISDSYYFSGIVSPEFETVSRSQSSVGLRLLNDLLSEKAISAAMIPYVTHTEVSTVAGQSEYDVDNLVDLEVMTFSDGDVRYEMTRDMQRSFFGTPQVTDIQSLPFHFYAERQMNKMVIYLYFLPDQVYTLNITGKYKLSALTLDTDLTEVFDDFYVSYLKFLLSSRLCAFNQAPVPVYVEKELKKFNRELNKIEGVDLSVVRPSMTQYNFPDADGRSFWNGWMP